MTAFSRLDGINYSLEDLQRKFKGSVCQFRYGDKVFVDMVIEIAGTGVILQRTGRVPRKDLVLVKELPESSIVNHSDGIIYYLRYPARQFRRGAHAGNSIILDQDGQQFDNPSLEQLDSLFNPSTTDMFVAIKLLEEGKVKARALTNNLYWMKKEGQQIHLYRKAIRVAIWMKDRFYYEKCAKAIEVELKDDLGVG